MIYLKKKKLVACYWQLGKNIKFNIFDFTLQKT